MLNIRKNGIKLFGLLLCLSMFIATFMHAKEGDFKISYRSYSPDEMKKFERALTDIGFPDVGHSATFVSLNSKLKNAGIIYHVERPVLKGSRNENDLKITCLLSELSAMSEITKNEFPHTIISSRGFLPGEEIEVYFQSGILLSNILKITHFPIRDESGRDQASISAKLISLSPTVYGVYFNDFGVNENLELLSESSGEKFINKIKVNKKAMMTQMPAVINKQGGINYITVTREGGEQLKINLPWGNEQLKYLYGEKSADNDYTH